ncbi:competence protein CoiA [Paraliobacillus sp. PM-2]|uniref:competence protein CoiA n=1 Tax=Paraliobacillus sp. PM-2 TaxID=1462524 RepID=UPI00159EDB28|nr:competence protein CoiA family protein [Paraliobacillus sp. PM-2]
MLKAISKDGQIIILPLLSRDVALSLKSKHPFYCPCCKERVNIRIGDKRIAHFAHQRKSACAFSQGEGEYHEQGKIDLYDWLLAQGYYVELEKYLPQIKQRPDLLLFHNNKKIAIEFQCASIPIKQLISRTAGYQKLGIIPIWVLGGNRMRRRNHQQLYLTPTEHHFIHQFKANLPTYFFYYCPNSKKFAINQNSWLNGRRTAIGNLSFHPISQLKFVDLFKIANKTSEERATLWLVEKKQFRLYNSSHPSSSEKQWRQWLYLHRYHPTTLPSIIHLPVVSQWKMMIAPWNWQSRLCIDLLLKKKRVTFYECQQFLTRYMIPDYKFPLVYAKHHPIKEYLNILLQLQYIQEISHDTFQLQMDLTSYESLDKALEQDKLIMKQFAIL